VSIRGSLLHRSQSILLRDRAFLHLFQLVAELFLCSQKLFDIVADKVELPLQVYPYSHDEPRQRQ
jgi:hypothetical protein